MEKNAWFVSSEICDRIKDAPVLGQYIQAFVASPLNEIFFFNNDELQSYHHANGEAKENVAGSAYIYKILQFHENHYIQGKSCSFLLYYSNKISNV